MKKGVKNSIFTLMAGLMVSLLSCKEPTTETKGNTDNDHSVIRITNVTNSNIAGIIAVIWSENQYDDWDVIASCMYKDNGFTMQLPKTLAAKYLLDDFFDAETMNNPSAKCAVIEDIIGLDSDGEPIGYFELKNEMVESNATYLYADRDFTVKRNDVYQGSTHEDHNEIDCSFKKGWNIMYEYVTIDTKNSMTIYTWKTTTQKPLEMNFNWYFYSYD